MKLGLGLSLCGRAASGSGSGAQFGERYMVIDFMSFGNSLVDMKQLKVEDSGGTDYMQSATLSSVHGGTPNNLKDADDDTWAPTDSAAKAARLVIDMGVGNTIDPVVVKVTSRNSASASTQTPGGMVFYSSPDGTTLTPVSAAINSTTPVLNTEYTYNITPPEFTGSHIWFGSHVIKESTFILVLSEIDLEIANVDQTLASAAVSGYTGTRVAANLIDGSLSTRWEVEALSGLCAASMSSAAAIDQIRLTAGATTLSAYAPTSGQIIYGDDGNGGAGVIFGFTDVTWAKASWTSNEALDIPLT